MTDVSDTYRITLSGSGVTSAAAVTAFEAVVAALRLVTGEGGNPPDGTLEHTEGTTERAVDVAP